MVLSTFIKVTGNILIISLFFGMFGCDKKPEENKELRTTKQKNTDIWENFLDHPNEQTFKACDTQLDRELTLFKKHPHRGRISPDPSFLVTGKQLLSKSKRFTEFCNIISKGNHYAAKLAFKVYPQTDAAHKESLIDCLSDYMDKDPKKLLILLKKYRHFYGNQDLLKHIVPFTGYKLVDQYKKQVERMERRFSHLEKIQDPELKSIVDDAKKEVRQRIDNSKYIVILTRRHNRFKSEAIQALKASLREYVSYVMEHYDVFYEFYVDYGNKISNTYFSQKHLSSIDQIWDCIKIIKKSDSLLKKVTSDRKKTILEKLKKDFIKHLGFRVEHLHLNNELSDKEKKKIRSEWEKFTK